MSRAQATPSPMPVAVRRRTASAINASIHNMGAATYADGATGLRSAARFNSARATS